ncbi:MAG: heavy metal sensor histidine kinase [Phycisphaerales bacterium]|nr:heavy metal sensor histidine kinase [Phycisphaerales bacterium]
MSSKNAEQPAPPRRRFFFARWSIVARLTALYTVLAFTILVLAAGFLHWTLAVNLHREDAQFLADKVHLLRTILSETSGNATDLTEEVRWETASLHFTRYYARILDQTGRTLIESPGMSKVLPVGAFAAPSRALRLETHVTALTSAHGQTFMLLAAFGRSASAKSMRQIQVALDVSSEEVFLQRYRRDLAWAVLVGALFSAAAGAFIARRGMRPLADLAAATDRISASQLHERVGGEGWPTELTSLAKAFDRMLDRLEDSFRRLTQFSGDLAHELRTPINNLRGEAGVALSQSRSPEEYRRTLESSLEEYARISRLIDNLLFLARTDDPTAIGKLTPCEARQAAESVCDFYAAMAEDRNVHIQCMGQATVYADPVLLRQTISNLLSNALNYTLAGGNISVEVRNLESFAAEVVVKDTGSGIAPEHLRHIFDRLYRADPARSRHPEGAGLGLAIVQSIMVRHGGSVTVESTLGKGSCFTLRFPPT